MPVLPQLRLEDGRETPCLPLSSVLLSRSVSVHFIFCVLLLYHCVMCYSLGRLCLCHLCSQPSGAVRMAPWF